MDGELPLLPGFREMALRRMSAERGRLVADLTARRQAAGLSQTEVAARMRTSQSAVARLEAGEGDVRMSTLERYAAAVGSDITWQVRPRATPQDEADDHSSQPRSTTHPAVASAATGTPLAANTSGNARPAAERAGPRSADTRVDRSR